METTVAARTEPRGGPRSTRRSAVVRPTTCIRCGGLMVGDFCMDLLNGTGELEFLASRCVQCGEVVDPVILKNRRMALREAIVGGGKKQTNLHAPIGDKFLMDRCSREL